MKAYLFELRESDGNNCTVYDCIIEAESAQEALEELSADLDSRAKRGGWESDGFCGYYFPCDCQNEEPEAPPVPCDSCAMLSINGVACHEAGCPREARYRREMRAYDRFDCPGHGGLTVSEEPEEYPDYETAEKELRPYHSLYTV